MVEIPLLAQSADKIKRYRLLVKRYHMNTTLGCSSFAVETYCKENIIFHKNIIEHTMKYHSTQLGFFKCIAKDNCEVFSNARDLSYHLILKHYDLMFLKISLNCPECREGYNSFLEFNEHYCCIKGVLNRSSRVCSLCKIEFPSHKRFRVHQMFHSTSYRPKICFLCDVVFKMEEDFYEHIMFHHKTKEQLKLVCTRCDKVSTSEELYKKHIKSHMKDFVAKCPICSNSYRSRYSLTLHIRHVHEEREHNDCKICGKEFHFKGQLKLHLDRHNELKEGKVFVCSTCGLCEPDVKYFEDHKHDEHRGFYEESTNIVYSCEFCEQAYIQTTFLKSHKEESNHVSYNCDMCDQTFNSFPILKTHRLTHEYGDHKISKYPTGRKYVCNTKICDCAFLHFYELRKHNYTHNWFDTMKTCKLCGKTMSNYVGMINHLENEHAEIPLDNIAKLRCSACQKMFKTKNGLSSHMSARHGAHEHQCNECKRSFKTEQVLLNHHKHFHDNVVCHICGKTLRNRHLPFHINSVHKKIIRFKCTECDRGYYLNSDLQDHIKLMHNSNKPEKCDQCAFSCHYPSRLKLHILQKHEGKPAPFKCKECSSGFFTENTLRSHMLQHGPKNYECLIEECDWKFYTRAHLINHGKKVHKMDFSNDAPKIKRKRSKKCKDNKATKRRKSQTNIKEEDSEFQAEVVDELYAMEVEYLEEEFPQTTDVIKHENINTDNNLFLNEYENVEVLEN